MSYCERYYYIRKGKLKEKIFESDPEFDEEYYNDLLTDGLYSMLDADAEHRHDDLLEEDLILADMAAEERRLFRTYGY